MNIGKKKPNSLKSRALDSRKFLQSLTVNMAYMKIHARNTSAYSLLILFITCFLLKLLALSLSPSKNQLLDPSILWHHTQ